MEELYKVIFFDELLELPSLYEPLVPDPYNKLTIFIGAELSNFVDSDIGIRRRLFERQRYLFMHWYIFHHAFHPFFGQRNKETGLALRQPYLFPSGTRGAEATVADSSRLIVLCNAERRKNHLYYAISGIYFDRLIAFITYLDEDVTLVGAAIVVRVDYANRVCEPRLVLEAEAAARYAREPPTDVDLGADAAQDLDALTRGELERNGRLEIVARAPRRCACGELQSVVDIVRLCFIEIELLFHRFEKLPEADLDGTVRYVKTFQVRDLSSLTSKQ